MQINETQVFIGNKIRTVWDNEKEEWYFSVVDIVGVLSESENANNYWKVLKKNWKMKEMSWLQFLTNLRWNHIKMEKCIIQM